MPGHPFSTNDRVRVLKEGNWFKGIVKAVDASVYPMMYKVAIDQRAKNYSYTDMNGNRSFGTDWFVDDTEGTVEVDQFVVFTNY